ncbi:hypothetical protein [Chryseobacterium sp. Bi04]|uniref:hypothetical protein n=1 Tax=Chryseobacterium sp. Bi04 TaxID=2822345 RepID=UPI001DCE2F84|nr:hypothetical protein [Chryseobacterium sp. Bi04]CAH0251529.1 hypothetical protein SRABI04_03244 [Chryseobacterium sp. Bi04]
MYLLNFFGICHYFTDNHTFKAINQSVNKNEVGIFSVLKKYSIWKRNLPDILMTKIASEKAKTGKKSNLKISEEALAGA